MISTWLNEHFHWWCHAPRNMFLEKCPTRHSSQLLIIACENWMKILSWHDVYLKAEMWCSVGYDSLEFGVSVCSMQTAELATWEKKWETLSLIAGIIWSARKVSQKNKNYSPCPSGFAEKKRKKGLVTFIEEHYSLYQNIQQKKKGICI